MISALAGRKTVLDAYAFALKNDFRFFSYGDAMLIL
jgi:S-adenosylmethionine:tRNA ribosyltransferase-isomerase